MFCTSFADDIAYLYMHAHELAKGEEHLPVRIGERSSAYQYILGSGILFWLFDRAFD